MTSGSGWGSDITLPVSNPSIQYAETVKDQKCKIGKMNLWNTKNAAWNKKREIVMTNEMSNSNYLFYLFIFKINISLIVKQFLTNISWYNGKTKYWNE